MLLSGVICSRNLMLRDLGTWRLNINQNKSLPAILELHILQKKKTPDKKLISKNILNTFVMIIFGSASGWKWTFLGWHLSISIFTCPVPKIQITTFNTLQGIEFCLFETFGPIDRTRDILMYI